MKKDLENELAKLEQIKSQLQNKNRSYLEQKEKFREEYIVMENNKITSGLNESQFEDCNPFVLQRVDQILERAADQIYQLFEKKDVLVEPRD